MRQVYSNKNMSNHMNNSVVLGGFVYGFDGNTHMAGPKQLVCLRLADGTVQWRKEGYRCGSLMAVQNHLLVLGETGNLSPWFQPRRRTSSQSLQGQVLNGRCWTVPVLSNGRIFARNAAGDLICVDARK